VPRSAHWYPLHFGPAAAHLNNHCRALLKWSHGSVVGCSQQSDPNVPCKVTQVASFRRAHDINGTFRQPPQSRGFKAQQDHEIPHQRPSRLCGVQRSLSVQRQITRNRTSVVSKLVKTYFEDGGEGDNANPYDNCSAITVCGGRGSNSNCLSNGSDGGDGSGLGSKGNGICSHLEGRCTSEVCLQQSREFFGDLSCTIDQISNARWRCLR
jgi:hypothetical protein